MSLNSWVTLATNDSYSLGALVLAHSLRRADTAYQLTILVTPGVSSPMRSQLSAVFNVVEEVNVLDSRDEKNLALLTRPELGITFTKLHCWRLTQFTKCVFVDADVMILKNCDELFEREELSAAPDVGWPDCFNSGVFVYRPSIDTYNAIINFALTKGSFDGGDQGLLNQFFSDWATRDISHHLPFIYNMCSTATYSYLPAFKQFGKDVKIVHFIGPAKPWLQYLDSQSRQVTPSSGSEHLQELLQLWWDIFCHHVHSNLSPDMVLRSSQTTQLENSSISQIVREIFYNLQSCSSQNKPQVSAYEQDPSDGFWDPWESYIEPSHTPETQYQSYFQSQQEGQSSSLHTQISEESVHSRAHSLPYCAIQEHYGHTAISSHTNSNQYQENQAHLQHHIPSEQEDPHYKPHEHNQHYEQHTHLKHDCERNPQHSEGSRQHHHHHHHHSMHYQQHQYNHELESQKYMDQDDSQHNENLDQENSNKLHFIVDNYTNDTQHTGLNTQMNEDTVQYEIDNIVSHNTDLPQISCPQLPDDHSFPSDNKHSTNNEATTDTKKEAGLAGAFAQLTLGEARTDEQVALEEHLRKQAWEHGSIDYMGRDSFDNIWRKICQTLAQTPQEHATVTDQGASDSSETLAGPVATESEAESTPTPEHAESMPIPASQNEIIPTSSSVSHMPEDLPSSTQEEQRGVQLSQAGLCADQDVDTPLAPAFAAVGSDQTVVGAMPAPVPSDESDAAVAVTEVVTEVVTSVTPPAPLPARSAETLPSAQSAYDVSTAPATATVSSLSANAAVTPQTPAITTSQSVATAQVSGTTTESPPVFKKEPALTQRAKKLEAILAEYTRDMPSQPSHADPASSENQAQVEESQKPQVKKAEESETPENPEAVEQTRSSGGLSGTSANILEKTEVKPTSSVPSSCDFEYESVKSTSSESVPVHDVLPSESSKCVPIPLQGASAEAMSESKGGTSACAQTDPKQATGGPAPSPNPVVVTAYVKQIPGVTIPPQSQFVAPLKAHASQTTCSTDQVTAVASATAASAVKGAVEITSPSQSLTVTEPTPPTSPESTTISPLAGAVSTQALQVESDIPATPPVVVPTVTQSSATASEAASTPSATSLTSAATVSSAATEATASAGQGAQQDPSASQDQDNSGAPVPPKRNKKPGGKSAKNVKPQAGKK